MAIKRLFYVLNWPKMLTKNIDCFGKMKKKEKECDMEWKLTLSKNSLMAKNVKEDKEQKSLWKKIICVETSLIFYMHNEKMLMVENVKIQRNNLEGKIGGHFFRVHELTGFQSLHFFDYTGLSSLILRLLVILVANFLDYVKNSR